MKNSINPRESKISDKAAKNIVITLFLVGGTASIATICFFGDRFSSNSIAPTFAIILLPAFYIYYFYKIMKEKV